jgi:capsular exopolysaccharide synthesis family protein
VKPIPDSYGDIPGGRGARAEPSGLLYYWQLLWQRKGNLLVAGFLGAVAGLLITLPQTRTYRAHGSVEIHDPGSPAPDHLASDAYLQTQMRLLESKALTTQVLQKMKREGQLHGSNENGRLAAWMKMLGIDRGTPSDPTERLSRELIGNLNVRSVGQTRILEIYAESGNPKAAADFVNALAAELIQQAMALGSTPGGVVDRLRSDLQSSEERLLEYERQNSPARAVPALQNLPQLQQELAAAKNDRDVKQAHYELARNAPVDSPPEALADQPIRETLLKLAVLRHELNQLSEKYTARHPKVVLVQDQITGTRTALENQMKMLVERAKSDYQDALSREKQLADAYNAQLTQANTQPDQAPHIALVRQVELNRQLYEQALQKTREASVTAGSGATRMVDRAEIPEAPYKPSLSQNVIFGLLGGLLLGIAFVVTREHSDRTIQQPGDATNWFHIRELGAIPPVTRHRFRRAKQNRNGNGHRAGAQVPATTLPLFIASNESTFDFVESIRSALLSIVYAGNGGDSRRVFAFTSPNPGDGKTTVATNLAIAFAGLGRKVLLLDGDLRRPRIHQLFGMTKDRGVCDLLERKISEDAISEVIRESGIKNLFVLTSGEVADESALLMHEKRFGELIARFRADFDTVIIDTPPVLVIPDARVIGRAADAVVVVVRSGKTTPEALDATRERLTQDGIPLLGVILNDWDPRRAATGYYGSYDRSYGQYYTAKEEVKR